MQREDSDSQELSRIIDGVFEYIDERQRRESTSNQSNDKICSFYRCAAVTHSTITNSSQGARIKTRTTIKTDAQSPPFTPYIASND